MELTRTQIVDYVNAANTTWTAALNERFGEELPLHSSRGLYGAITPLDEDIARALKSGELEMVEKISDEEAAALPDSFDSAENWPKCAKVINDIRDQSNCGCCWAFGAASAASDRACIASDGEIAVPFSAQDVCFNAESSGCNGGTLMTPWSFISRTGVVTGGQYSADRDTEVVDPFDGEDHCAAFSLPHCCHHGPSCSDGSDPFPSEGEEGCPSVKISPRGPSSCDSGSALTYSEDKYSFSGVTKTYASDAATIMAAIQAGGPVEAAFTVYSDFENYASGIYEHKIGTVEGGHAIRIVGWGTEDGTDYWKVANSWNPHWGEGGYFRIKRGTDECGIEDQVYSSGNDATWSRAGGL